MTLALIGLAATSLLELLLWLPPVRRWRKAWAGLLIFGLSVVVGLLISRGLGTWAILLAILSLYRIINLLRLVEDRIQADYLFRVARRTSLWLIGLQLVTLAIVGLNYYYHVNAMVWWYVLASLQAAGSAVLLASTMRHLRTTTPPVITKTYANRDLPTLTVAIPARNETADLEACLRSLLASTYPKLEILVLDDCSQNKRTPEVIRSFAHDGVRFVAGTAPPGQWLAKNHAYARLADESNGELLLFCGVDTRFEPESLSRLVKTMLQKKKTMISVIPRNTPPSYWKMVSLFVQPNRYAWELALPRRLLQRPPVLSTCWLISRQALDAAGGFKAVSRKAVPESYLARAAVKNDGYSFLQSGAAMGISTRKTLDEQRNTALRTRYPQLHRRPELVALVCLTELSLSIWPLIVLIVAIISQVWALAVLSGLSYLMTSLMYGKIVNLTYRRFVIRGIWLLPVAAAYDIGLLNYSMWQYEFREVIWKGRNVCIPVMRVIPRLPNLEQKS